jgi:tetratricopeptide (TPR) repeat protein
MAHLWQAYWNIFLVGQGWAKNPHQAIREAGRAAERAMVLDPKDARGLTVAGHVRAFLDKRLNEAMALHEQALQLNATLPLAWHFFGMAYAYAGRIDEAQSHFLRALKLAPEAPFAFLPQSGLAIVHLLRGEHEACVLASRRVTERYQNFSAAYKFYLAALGHLGEKEEAGLVLQRLRLREPSFSLRTLIRGMPYKREQDLQHIVVGLRRAGLT